MSLRPTIMPMVPRLLNRFYDLIHQNIESLSGFKRWLAKTAIATKLKNLQQNGTVTHSLYDYLVFSKMKALFGGRIKYMVIGTIDNILK